MNWLRQLLWFMVLTGALLFCLMAGWLLQASQSYGYSFWYDWYDIGTHIERFGPQNRYIRGLNELPKSEHVRLFDDIATAVHQHGEGLADIAFSRRSGPQVRLLRQPEIQHLQDVADLIDTMTLAGLMAGILALIVGRGLIRRKILPRWRIQLGWLAAFIALPGLILLIAGPKDVFYQLHVWIFPQNHQWFFYYQESLMSTLMKAPDLFAGIAVAIVLSGFVLFTLLIAALLFWQRRQIQSA